MSGYAELVETVRQALNDVRDGYAGRTDPLHALAALSVLAADLQAAEQRAEEARPIETLDESSLRTIQAQAARVAALETAVAGLEQRADGAEKALRRIAEETYPKGYSREHCMAIARDALRAAAVVSAEPTEEQG